MAERVAVTLVADTLNGPEISGAVTQVPEGVTVLSVLVASGASDLEVTGVDAALVDLTLFAIKSTGYLESALPVLGYKANLDSNPLVVLDQMQILTGGALALLPGPLDKIFLSNSGTGDYTVTIMIGGDVTP